MKFVSKLSVVAFAGAMLLVGCSKPQPEVKVEKDTPNEEKVVETVNKQEKEKAQKIYDEAQKEVQALLGNKTGMGLSKEIFIQYAVELEHITESEAEDLEKALGLDYNEEAKKTCDIIISIASETAGMKPEELIEAGKGEEYFTKALVDGLKELKFEDSEIEYALSQYGWK